MWITMTFGVLVVIVLAAALIGVACAIAKFNKKGKAVPMKNQKGFTLIELMICVAVIGILFAAIASMFMNNRGATEQRAYEGAQKFMTKNSIEPKRITCAGDSDGNGYGTCTIASKSDGEIITLECPTDWIDTGFWGASGCKEIPIIRMQGAGIAAVR